MTPVRVGVGVGAGLGAGPGWRRDNRPDFPGVAVWVDAVAEVEIDAVAFGFGGGGDGDFSEWSVHHQAVHEEHKEHKEHKGYGEHEGRDPVPWSVDARSPEYGKVWLPLAGSGREPRPGLLLSVVRAGGVVACPTPLPDPPTGALAHALARVERPVPRPEMPAVDVEPAPPPRRAPSQKAYSDVRALVGMLVEVLVGRRAAAHASRWSAPEVCGKLRTPRYARTTTLKSVRLSESGEGVEALALLRDGARTRAVALRFDRDEQSRWRCTALQTG